MTGRYKAYPEYKDSGVDWFGNIPSHWRISGFKKHISSIVDYRGKTPIKTDEGVLLVTARNVKNGKLDYSLSQEYIAPDDYDDVMSRGKPKIGHVLFTTEAPLGEVANIDRVDFALAQRIIKFNGLCNHLTNYYFKYLIMSEEFQQSLNLFASGSTVKGIKAERFVYLRNLLPSYEEQQKIASFLDHETAKIDTLIAKQEKLIELLKEKRQAVISHAVTKGLNPDAPMRDSGVEWLGEVPEHWDVCCLKHIKGDDKGSFVDGPFGSNLKSEHFVDNGDVYVIESNFATTGLLDTAKLKTISTEHFETISRSETTEGAIIIAKIGARYGMNSVMPALDKKAVVSGNSLSLKINEQAMNVQYCHHLLTHLKQEGAMDDGVNVTAQPALSLGQLNNLPFLRPSKEEQQAIVDFIQQQEKSLSSLILNAERMIELSRERKTALISAAVTGKIDVRDFVSEQGQPQGVQG